MTVPQPPYRSIGSYHTMYCTQLASHALCSCTLLQAAEPPVNLRRYPIEEVTWRIDVSVETQSDENRALTWWGAVPEPVLDLFARPSWSNIV